jgi:hypothetical protein
MVMKRKSVKSIAKKVAYIITATFGYGPFRSKADAEAHRQKVSNVNGSVVSSVKKVAKGYAFTSKTHIGAQNAAMKNQAIASVKQHAPSARISVKSA